MHSRSIIAAGDIAQIIKVPESVALLQQFGSVFDQACN